MGDENIFIEERKGGERKKERKKDRGKSGLGWEVVVVVYCESFVFRINVKDFESKEGSVLNTRFR